MKKNFKLIVLIYLLLILLVILSMWVLTRASDEYKSLVVLYFGFYINYMVSLGPRGTPGYILLRKTEFRYKRILVFDFERFKHIPIRLAYLQIASLIFLVIGLLLWLTLYLLLISKVLVVLNMAKLLLIVLLYYSGGLGGVILLIGFAFTIYEFTKYRGEYYVDSKIFQ